MNANHISSLPSFVSQLSNLKRLLLRGNQITELGNFNFPNQLEFLDLSENPINSINSCRLFGLKHLDLTNTSLTFNRTFLHPCPLPDQLTLSHNKNISEGDTNWLNRFRDAIFSVQKITLDYCNLEGNLSLDSNSSTITMQLSWLSVNNNKLSGTVPAWVNKLTYFSARRNDFNAIDVDALKYNPQIRRDLFDLSLNNINQDVKDFLPLSNQLPAQTILNNNSIQGSLVNYSNYHTRSTFSIELRNNPELVCLGLPVWCSGPAFGGNGDCW